jgi:hypothetical protein
VTPGISSHRPPLAPRRGPAIAARRESLLARAERRRGIYIARFLAEQALDETTNNTRR